LAPRGATPRRIPAARPLSAAQVEAIRSAMRVFVDDDLARGTEPQRRAYCDGCERARPAAGFIQYDRYCLCNDCATEYEVARARALVSTPGQYIRDKRFGDGDYYAL
jgi:formate dehydrogenase maturation protein FdhE